MSKEKEREKLPAAASSDIPSETSDSTVLPSIFPVMMAGKPAGAAKINASVPLCRSRLMSPAEEKQMQLQIAISPAPSTT